MDGDGKMTADLLISSVLQEGRKQLASIDRNADPAQLKRFRRREHAFLTMETHPESTIGKAMNTSFGGVRFQSPVRELSLKHLLPLLQHHKENLGNTDDIRGQAEDEYNIHKNLEINRIIKAINRNNRKLNASGLTNLNGGSHRKEDETGVPQSAAGPQSHHDAWDHGYSGSLPSYHGENIAQFMTGNRLGYQAPKVQVGVKKNPLFGNMLDTTIDVQRGKLPRHMMEIPVEHVLAWSKALRSRRVRGLQGGPRRER